MKNTAGSHSSSLFLLELVVAILIFALASAVPLQFFAAAHLWNKQAEALNFFSNECSNVAEITGVSSSRRMLEENLKQLYPDGIFSNREITLYYNENLEPAPKEDSVYIYTITLQEENLFLTATMRIWDASLNTLVYELESKHHLGGIYL